MPKNAADSPKKAAKKPRTEAAERSTVPRNPQLSRVVPSGKAFKIVSWNITTLRSLMDKNANMLKKLITAENADLICLQETKIKMKDRPEFEGRLKQLLGGGWSYHWAISEPKLGYAGTLAIASDSFAPLSVKFGLPTLGGGGVAKDVNSEGRTITLEYDKWHVVATYVPNSGQSLDRLDFRTGQWDKKLVEHLQNLEKTKPVVWAGDLNVAHQVGDIYNAGGIDGIPAAKHLEKTAGCTMQERDSFTKILDLGFVDTFRHQYPGSTGWYTYWSVRAGNRPFNRGLRLDYFIASKKLIEGKSPTIVDSAILPDYVAIDHAACACTLRV